MEEEGIDLGLAHDDTSHENMAVPSRGKHNSKNIQENRRPSSCLSQMTILCFLVFFIYKIVTLNPYFKK